MSLLIKLFLVCMCLCAMTLPAMANSAKPLTCPNGAPLQQLKAPTFNGCGSQAAIEANIIPDKFINNKLTPCCNVHDICYGTVGRTQKACDEAFDSCTEAKCYAEYKGPNRLTCRAYAKSMYAIVDLVGKSAFEVAQREFGCPAKGDDEDSVEVDK